MKIAGFIMVHLLMIVLTINGWKLSNPISFHIPILDNLKSMCLSCVCLKVKWYTWYFQMFQVVDVACSCKAELWVKSKESTL